MGDEHRAHALATEDPPEVGEQRVPRGRIEGGEGLVEEQDLRLEHERPRERHALRFAPRERARRAVGELPDPEMVEPPRDARPAHRRGDAAEAEPEGDVLLHGRVSEERLLEDRGHAPPGLEAPPGRDGGTPDPDRARGGRLEEAEDAEQRRLARAVRPDDREDLPVLELEGGDVEDERAGVTDGDVRQRDDGHGHAEGRTWMEPRWMEICQERSRGISRIS